MQAIANVLANAIERRSAEERTRHEALHDPLTGLPNRNLFLDRLEHALAQARRRHATRSRSSSSTSTSSSSSTTASATPPATSCSRRSRRAWSRRCAPATPSPASAATSSPSWSRTSAASATRSGSPSGSPRRSPRPFVLREREHFVSASIGISIGSGGEAPEALIRDADAALYRAKERGPRRLRDLRRGDALARDRPHADRERPAPGAAARRAGAPLPADRRAAATARSSMLEALLRWRHPERGLIGPGGLHPGRRGVPPDRPDRPLGARAGLPRGRRAGRRCDPDGAPVGVAVNLSARQLADPRAAATRSSGDRAERHRPVHAAAWS